MNNIFKGHERDEALENEAAEARKVQEELMNDFDLMQVGCVFISIV